MRIAIVPQAEVPDYASFAQVGSGRWTGAADGFRQLVRRTAEAAQPD